jgi:hypothetical protein
MSADLAARLRALAQDYHEGRINLAAYRTLRAPLLDSLVATVPRAADTEVTRPRAVRPTPVAAEGASTEPEPAKRLPVGVIAGVLSVVALAAVLFWVFGGERAPGGDAGETASEKSLAGPVNELVAPFMERADWSDAQLTHLNASLLELGDRELGRAAAEPWFQRFVDELRRRLKEHQALAATPLTADNSAIAALAVTVGLDLNSPDAAIQIATVEEPPAPPDEKHAQTPAAGRTERPLDDQGAAHDAGSKPAPAAVKVASIDPAERATSGTGAVVDPSAGTSTKAPVASSAAPAPTTVAASHDGACRVELVRSRRPLCNDLLPTGEGP